MDLSKPPSKRGLIWPTPVRVSYAQEDCIPVSSRELKRLYDELHRSERDLRTLVERSPDALCVADANDAIVYVNEALRRLLGYPDSSELLGRPAVTTLVHPDDLGKVADARRRQLAGERVDPIEIRCLRRDGTPVYIEGSSTLIDFDGKPASLTTARDITERLRGVAERRRLEERIQHAQKMEAVGKLAGGIAHDFNNLLGVVIGGVGLVLEDLGEAPASVREGLASVMIAAERAAGLTKQLLAASRAMPQRRIRIDLNAVIAAIGPALDRSLGESIAMDRDLATPLGLIEADQDQLEQLLQHLVANARDAMPDGGKVRIETSSVVLDAAEAAEAGVRPGPYVALVVTDTGVGMDAATRARIFEPFFTTKGMGEGKGLGLAVVFGIVKECGGSISVTSGLGQGTTLRLLFPRVGEPVVVHPAHGKTAPAPEQRAQTSATVLVVEDDAQVRTVVHRVLTRAGYTVIVADGPLAALAVLNQRTGIDLVVTDLAMPGMDGRSMAALASARDPGLRFLFMSGYAEHAAVKGAPLGAADCFLAKPFTPQALKDAVRGALDRAK